MATAVQLSLLADAAPADAALTPHQRAARRRQTMTVRALEARAEAPPHPADDPAEPEWRRHYHREMERRGRIHNELARHARTGLAIASNCSYYDGRIPIVTFAATSNSERQSCITGVYRRHAPPAE